MKRDWRQQKHCVKIFYYVERGDSGERLEQLVSLSTVHSTLFSLGFVEFVRAFQTALMWVSVDERKLRKALNFFHFSDLAAQGPCSQKLALIFFVNEATPIIRRTATF